MESDQEGANYQFNIAFMTHPMKKKHGNHREKVIKMFESEFKTVTVKCIQR